MLEGTATCHAISISGFSPAVYELRHIFLFAHPLNASFSCSYFAPVVLPTSRPHRQCDMLEKLRAHRLGKGVIGVAGKGAMTARVRHRNRRNGVLARRKRMIRQKMHQRRGA